MLGMTYFTLLFTQYVPEAKTRYMIGYVMIMMFISTVAFNLALICTSILRTLILFLRRLMCVNRKKNLKKLKIGEKYKEEEESKGKIGLAKTSPIAKVKG